MPLARRKKTPSARGGFAGWQLQQGGAGLIANRGRGHLGGHLGIQRSRAFRLCGWVDMWLMPKEAPNARKSSLPPTCACSPRATIRDARRNKAGLCQTRMPTPLGFNWAAAAFLSFGRCVRMWA